MPRGEDEKQRQQVQSQLITAPDQPASTPMKAPTRKKWRAWYDEKFYFFPYIIYFLEKIHVPVIDILQYI